MANDEGFMRSLNVELNDEIRDELRKVKVAHELVGQEVIDDELVKIHYFDFD
jgi:hypothetical protein